MLFCFCCNTFNTRTIEEEEEVKFDENIFKEFIIRNSVKTEYEKTLQNNSNNINKYLNKI